MENRIEHQLQFGAARPQNRVKAAGHAGEGGLGLHLDDPDGHEQAARQGNGKRRNDGGQGVLAQAPQNDQPECHIDFASVEDRLIDLFQSLHRLKLFEHVAVVTDQKKGGAIFQARRADQGERFRRVLVVQVAGRFVGEDEFGPVGQRARHGRALLLAGAQLAGVMFQMVPQADPFQQFPREHPVHARPKRHSQEHVFQAGITLQQIEGLKNVPDGGGPQTVALRFAQGRSFPCRPRPANRNPA